VDNHPCRVENRERAVHEWPATVDEVPVSVG
jgi:hypothetical protein